MSANRCIFLSHPLWLNLMMPRECRNHRNNQLAICWQSQMNVEILFGFNCYFVHTCTNNRYNAAL